MPVYKNKNGNGWYVMARYTDWQGNKKQKCQRGFDTKREAQDFEAQFILKKKADISMTLESFCELYAADIRPRIKETTWITKENIIRTKIIPYLGKRRLCEITAKDIVDWQNEIMKLEGANDKPISPTYQKTIEKYIFLLLLSVQNYPYGAEVLRQALSIRKSFRTTVFSSLDNCRPITS